MKILLLNDNPVVNKLVTLSAQKTSDELDVVDSLDNILKDSYDLLVIDDTVYQDDMLNEIKNKITYSQSLFICSRDTEEVDAFDSIIKKPFLPTDLVELFSSISKELDMIELSNEQEEEEQEEEEPLSTVEDEIALDDEFEDLDDDFGEDIDLGEETSQSVLDSDEAQKVKELLDETSDEFDEEISLEDDLDLELEDSLDLESEETVAEDDTEEEIPLEDDLDLELEDSLDLESEETVAEDDIEEEIPLDDELDLELEDSLELEDEDTVVEEDTLEEEIPLNDVNIEDQIKTAMSELSEEELEEEVSEDTLLEIAQNEIDPLDSLNSKDLKLAIGEEVEEDTMEDSSEDEIEEVPLEENSQDVAPSADGVEALKNLLTALNDKNVAASMKGMKISINITLGDN